MASAPPGIVQRALSAQVPFGGGSTQQQPLSQCACPFACAGWCAEPEKMAQARNELAKGIGKVARIVGLGTGTVHRLKREMTAGD